MYKAKGLILMAVVLLAASASAQFYKYRDPDGNIVFTDDITRVPRDQQPAVEKYKDYDAPTPQSQPESPPRVEATSPAADNRENDQKAAEPTDERTRDFDAIKKELELEYQALTKEKAALDGKKNFKNKKAADEYNRRVSELNERIDSYERKKRAFNAEVEKYNADQKKEIESLLESKRAKEPESGAPATTP